MRSYFKLRSLGKLVVPFIPPPRNATEEGGHVLCTCWLPVNAVFYQLFFQRMYVSHSEASVEERVYTGRCIYRSSKALNLRVNIQGPACVDVDMYTNTEYVYRIKRFGYSLPAVSN